MFLEWGGLPHCVNLKSYGEPLALQAWAKQEMNAGAVQHGHKSTAVETYLGPVRHAMFFCQHRISRVIALHHFQENPSLPSGRAKQFFCVLQLPPYPETELSHSQALLATMVALMQHSRIAFAV